MVNENGKSVPLRFVGFKIPGWMLKGIDEVQSSQRLVTRTEAARLVIVRGLDALGIDVSDVTEEETSETKDSIERVVIKGEKTCKNANA